MDVEEAASTPAEARSGEQLARFDIAAMRTHPVRDAIFKWLFDYPQREVWMALLRRFWPFPTFFGMVFVLRDEHVREVLAHDREFPVPWGGRMVKLTGSRNFVLGMEDGAEYRRNYEQLAKAFRREDVERYVVPQAAKASADILRDKERIDAVQDLIWAVPSQLCEDYYGIEIPDKLLLAEWTVAMSGYLFGSLNNRIENPGMDLALTAADGFRKLIRTAIEKTRGGHSRGVVLPRLIAMQKDDAHLTDDVVAAHLFGMVTGFIPTNLLAGGNMLDTLLRRHEFMTQARAAVQNQDDDLLWRCLRETLRFRHFNPGPVRICGAKEYTLAGGTRSEKLVAPGTMILASTQSAMFDRRVPRPRHFDPNREPGDYLVFGYGQHWCLGAHIATAQITQTFKALLRKTGMRRAPGDAGKLQMITSYPAHLTVEFDR